MKAIILAAGYATRLYPLTLNQPKPLLKLGEKPTLERILDEVNKVKEIDAVYVVTNHKFKPNFDSWLLDHNPEKKIEVIDDGTLSNDDRLGAIGDIDFVLKREKINEDTMVIAGDTLFDFDLYGLVNIRKKKNASVTTAKELEKEQIRKRLGNMILDKNNMISAFEEKPENPRTNLASVPIYLLRKEDLKEIRNCLREHPKLDNLGSFMKYMINKKSVYAYITKGIYFDIGSKEELNKADLKYGGKGKY